MVNLKPGSTYAGLDYIASYSYSSRLHRLLHPLGTGRGERARSGTFLVARHADIARHLCTQRGGSHGGAAQSARGVGGASRGSGGPAALVPFRHRVRAKKARSSYLCLLRHKENGITHTIQNMQELSVWATPDWEQDSRVRFCVFTGASRQRKGMALLSRICEPGGPLYRTNHYILDNFEPGEVLMVGYGILQCELPDVEVEDLSTPSRRRSTSCGNTIVRPLTPFALPWGSTSTTCRW